MTNKNRLLCAASMVAMALSGAIVSASVFADGNECSAETSTDTCTASTMDTLQLGLANNNVKYISVNGGMVVEGDVTLDISGKSLITSSVDGAFLIVDGTSLTIEGDERPASCGNPQTLTSFIQANGVLFNVSGTGQLNLKGGMSCSIDTVTVAVIGGGTVNISGGNVSSVTSAAIAGGPLDMGDMNVYITDGEVSGAKSAIYMPSQGILNISGGFVNGGIVARMGQINISNGATIWGRIGDQDVKDVLDNGVTALPIAIAALTGSFTSYNEEYGNSLNINITGGNFFSGAYPGMDSSPYSGVVKIFDAEKVAQNVTVNIAGGDFYSTAGQSQVDYYTRPEVMNEDGTIHNDTNLKITGGIYHETEPKTEYIANDYKIYSETRTIKMPNPNDSGFTEGSQTAYMVAQGKWPANIAKVEIIQKTMSEGLLAQDIDNAMQVLYDINALNAEGNKVSITNEEITLTVRLAKELMRGDEQYFQIAYVADDEKLTKQRFSTEVEERENEYLLTFTTTHLSQYVVMASATPFTVPSDDDTDAGDSTGNDKETGTPDTGIATKTGSSANIAGTSINIAVSIIALVLTTIIIKTIIRKKHWSKR